MPAIGEWHSQPGRIFQGMACGRIQKESTLQPPGRGRTHHVPTPRTPPANGGSPRCPLRDPPPGPGALPPPCRPLAPRCSPRADQDTQLCRRVPTSLRCSQMGNTFQFLRTCPFTGGRRCINTIFKLFSKYFMTWFGQGCD